MKINKGRKVSGKDYAEEEEVFLKKREDKEDRSMKTAGIAKALKKSRSEMDGVKLLKVKPQKKC